MTLTPATKDELAQALKAAHDSRTPAPPVDLFRLNRILRYAPEDLTVTIEAGLTLDSLQSALRRHHQWLPLDPPAAGGLTIAEIIDRNLSGPRRCGHGTVREHLIGIRVALADGRVIRSGGDVVKNVAGYDLMKLFVGARQSLGIVVEASFKLMPLPGQESFVAADCASWEEAAGLIEAVVNSPVTPVVFDLYRLENTPGHAAVLCVGCSGTHQDVEWQLARLTDLGLHRPSSLHYSEQFAECAGPSVEKISVLPSKLVETLRRLEGKPFVARAANGVIYRPAPPNPASAASPAALARRLKAEFDPFNILPALVPA